MIAIAQDGKGTFTIAGAALMAVTGSSWRLYSVLGKRLPNSFAYSYYSFLVFGSFASLFGIGARELLYFEAFLKTI